jgi:hypothetical protein
MKKILFISALILSFNSFAQQEKGDWYLGASSSTLGFTSSNGSENIIDATFTGFNDTLVTATDSLNLGFLFPYTYNLVEDKATDIDFSFRTGYFIDKNFQAGLGFGFTSRSTVFRTGADSQVANADLADSLMGVWFNGLPDVESMGATYANNYYELYSLIAASVNTNLTTSLTMLNITPFVRYYHTLKNGNLLFIDGSYQIGMGSEEIKEAVSNTTNLTNITSSKVNFGLGYSMSLSKHFFIEPQFNYFMSDYKSELVESTLHPILSINDLGEQTTTRTMKSSGINFSLGLSFYF